MARKPHIAVALALALAWTTILARAAGAQSPQAGPQNPLPAGGQFRSPLQAAPPASTTEQANPSHALPPPSSKERDSALSLPLAPRKEASTSGAASLPPILSGMASLAVVLGLFFVAVWALRRNNPKGSQLLPADVVEVLGRAPLPGRQAMQLIRCGHKLLLVCISAAGAETLTEITDPQEVDRLAGLCRQAHPHSATASFQQVFQQFGQKGARDFSDDDRLAARTRTAKRCIPATEDDDV